MINITIDMTENKPAIACYSVPISKSYRNIFTGSFRILHKALLIFLKQKISFDATDSRHQKPFMTP